MDAPLTSQTTLKIASWNINSVRLRLGLVLRFLQEQQPDILCLQETKCRDSEFPQTDFRKNGYPHLAICGQKGYHGVAILSRLPFERGSVEKFADKDDARHVSVIITEGAFAGTSVHNFYVPAGGDSPDPTQNEKFAHKLAFLNDMQAWSAKQYAAKARAIMVGDFNIAPLEHDVWSHKALLDVVSHTPQEVALLEAIMQQGQWRDAIRAHVPASEKLYSWWSYRARDWETSDRGRRLDHVWVSRHLDVALKAMVIVRAARNWERPSDHVPVMAELVHSCDM